MAETASAFSREDEDHVPNVGNGAAADAGSQRMRVGNTNDLRQRSLRPWVPSPLPLPEERTG